MIKKSRQGFTLAEALITLVIMSLVFAATIPIVKTASNQPAEAPWKYIVRGNLINNNAIYTAPENNSLSVIGDSRIPYDDGITEGDLPTIFSSQINPKLSIITQASKNANPVISRHLLDFYEKSGTNKHKSIGKISFDQNFNLAIGSNALDKTVREATADVALPNDTTKWCEIGDNAKGAANTAVGQYAMGGSKKSIEKDTGNNYRTITGIGNTALGAVAMQNITSGAWNVAIGPNSLQNVGKGDVNIAIGANSMKNTTTGLPSASTNIAIGVSALLGSEGAEQLQPVDNVVVGHYAMQKNTKGNNNVAIGNKSLGSNTEGQYNVAIGKDAMAASGAMHNTVAVGYGALRYNTEGVDNTAVGYQALFSNIGGGSNTALGNFALQGNKDGDNNTAIGYYALASNSPDKGETNGNNNTAVGASSLHYNTLGNDNTAIGLGALEANTTSSNNTAVGSYALNKYNRTGDESGYNTAVGTNSLRENTSNLCTGVGYNTLYYNSGTYNTALGSYALATNTSGTHNVSLGSVSLYKNTEGSKNIAIGYNALFNNTTGNGNIAIGTNVASGVTSGDNKLYIGGGTTGKNNADTVLIYGDMGAAELTINGTAYINNSYGKSQIVTKADLANLTTNLTTGNISVPSTVISDARLKNISGDSTAGLKEITQLKVKNFTYKSDKKKTPHVGVIAQDLQKIFPNSVIQDGLSKYLKISREEIFWACVNAIKELNDKIQDVIAKITGLDEKIRLLEARNKMNEDKITNLEHQNKLYEERLQAIEFQIAKQLENSTKTQNKLEDAKAE